MRFSDIKIGENHPPFIVAELSANHNGSIEQAKKTILEAKNSGAHAIKLQTYTPDTMTIDHPSEDFMIRGGLWDGKNLYELYQEAYTPWEWHKELYDYAKDLGIIIFSTPFDETAVDFLEELNNPIYKVASFEITDIPLLKKIASTKKTVIMSTGLATEEEIKTGIETLKSNGTEHLIVLHCVSAYPAKAEDYHLKTMLDIKNKFQVEVGLSDHSIGNLVASTSVALGAVLIEKHFILDRNLGGPDSSFSAEPAELKELCRITKETWLALGKVSYSLKGEENKNIRFRRSIFAVKDIKKGEAINDENVRIIRPNVGLQPKDIYKLKGMKAKNDIPRGTPLEWDLVN